MAVRELDMDGIRIHTESFGDERDPAVLMIMGAMASGVWWPAELCRRLAERGRFVIRYDHRDTGRSTSCEPGARNYDVEDLADDAVRVLNGYNLAWAHLVGMSLGGYLAQLVALKYPERVATLTLVSSERLAATDPALPPMDPAIAEYHMRAGDLDWSDREAVLEYQVGAWRLLAGSAHPFDAGAIRALAAEDYDTTPNPLCAFNHATLADADDWIGLLGDIRVPALIIHGTEDRVLPYEHALALQSELPNARLLTLVGTGHELAKGDWPAIVEAIAEHTAAP